MAHKIHMFKDAKFGDLFQTRDGCKALYLGSRGTDEWPSFAPHLLFIEEVGWSYFYDDGFDSGGVASYDITGPWDHDDEDRTVKLTGNQAAHLYDLLNTCALYITEAQGHQRKRKKSDDYKAGTLLHDIFDSIGLLKI